MNNGTLSKSQRLIMDVKWELGNANNAMILKKLSGVKDWSRHTVKTYLKQLTEKGFILKNQISTRKYYYKPLIGKENYLAEEASKYANENFEGVSYLVAGLVRKERVSDDEIEKLQVIINEYQGNNNE